MNKSRKNPRESAVSLLLEQRLHSLFIKLPGIRLRPDIIIDSVRGFCSVTMMPASMLGEENGLKDGFTLVRRTGSVRYVVLYNEKQENLRRRAFTIAHELGHIYLGHHDDENENEAEANAFASELLMPDALLREYIRVKPPQNPDELCGVFNVSCETAALRLQGVRRHKQSDIFPGEIELIKRLRGLLPTGGEHIVTF